MNFKITSKIIDKVNLTLTGNFIPGSAQIHPTVIFAYSGLSCVVHKSSKIGARTLIGQGVTIGAKEAYASSEDLAAPEIGNDCYISAGTRLLGKIKIGNQVIIGANSVVLTDLPDNSIAVGIPAKIIGTTNNDYRALRK